MPDLFFYGTLRDAGLRGIVFARDVPLSEARISGFRVVSGGQGVLTGAWPLLIEEAGAIAEGVVVRDASATDLARLDFYEGGFDFDRRRVMADTSEGACEVDVYLPRAEASDVSDWDLAAWDAQWGDMSRRAAADLMARFGTTSPEDARRLLPFLRSRAWGQVNQPRPASFDLRRVVHPDEVETEETDEGYREFFSLRTMNIRYRRFDRTWSPTLSRAAFEAYDAALVLPYDPVNDLVLLVEQMRYGPITRNDPDPSVLEPVAGLVDAGETPEQTARRECVEEAKQDVTRLLKVSHGYASPGYSTEYFHNFIGLCDLSGRAAQSHAGLEEEHEDIRNHVLPFDAAMALVESGEINAVPLQMLLFALAARRAALREGW